MFYKFAYETWLREGGLHPKKGVKDPFTQMAKGFGLGKPTGLDLPSEADGRIADRAWKKAYWKATKDFYCAKAKTGYPAVARTDPTRAAYLLQLSKENCVDGYAYRGGDAANFAIGQGDTLTTPLQMARVYAAVANGGTLVTPHIGKAIVTPEGKLVRRIDPAPAGRVPVSKATLSWLRTSLRTVTEVGTGYGPFFRAGFPLVEAAGRLQDRHRRGLRQAADLLVRDVRPGEQAAVRRRDDGQPGRHGVRHLRAVGRRAVQDAVRRQGPAGRAGQGGSAGWAPDRGAAHRAAGRHDRHAGVPPAGSRPGARRR